MRQKQEFWKRANDNHLEFRFWHADDQKFYADGDLEYFGDNSVIVYHDAEIQQCVGCKDINGHLIFEGDILETDEAGWKAVVVFGDGRFSLEDSKGGFSAEPNWNGCKIIGNVYQNPELIP